MCLEFTSLNVESATNEDIISALKNDQKTYYRMIREIETLSQSRVENPIIIRKDNNQSQNKNLKYDDKDDIDQNFEEEFNYYYKLVQEYKFLDFDDNMNDILPSSNNYQYKKILFRIYAELYREVCLSNKLLDSGSITKDEINKLSLDIKLLVKKIRIIQILLNEKKNEKEIQNTKENSIILLPNLNKKISIIDNLVKIDPEYYDLFYGLIKSIQDGTLKNVRTFTNHIYLSGLCEVKDSQARVIFRRLKRKGVYVIIGAFIKKVDNDTYYRDNLVRYNEMFKKNESYLQENIDNPDFIFFQDEKKAELFNMLNTKKLKK